MKPLEYINFYLTKPIYEELTKDHRGKKRIHNLNRNPVHIVSIYLYCIVQTIIQSLSVNTI